MNDIRATIQDDTPIARRAILRGLTALGILPVAGAMVLARPANSQQTPPVPSREDLLTVGETDIPFGDPSAPVRMFGYESFTCPHCAAFHSDVLPTLKADYIDSGKLQYVFRDFPLDGLALRASMLARCIATDKGTDRYAPFVNLLFSAQPQWARATDPVGALANLAKQAGLAQDRIDACLQDRPLAEAVVKHRRDGTQAFDIRSTPTFIFQDGRTLVGARPVEEFKAVIDDLIQKAS